MLIDKEFVGDIGLAGIMDIEVDEDIPEVVWLYKLDESGNRIEGGSFRMIDFLEVVSKFYSDNY